MRDIFLLIALWSFEAGLPVIEPLVYKRIDWEFHNLQSTNHPLISLLGNLLDRPELGKHVKSFISQVRKSIQSIRKYKDKPELSSRGLERLAGRAVHLTTYPSEPWLNEIQRGNRTAFFALLLCHCPNVKRLFLENDSLKYWSWASQESSWEPWIAPSIDTSWHAILNLRNALVSN